MLFHNIYGIILCILSVTKWISIKPIITWISNIIYEWYKDYFDRIKQNIRDTFLVKGNMTNTKQAIYLLHPHGIFSLTHAFHVNTDITNWPYRNVYSIISHIIDKAVPFALDFINDRNRMITSTYSYIKDALQDGKSISMCLGNFTEGQYDDDHRITAIVKKRKGIFKLAIESGIPIIPVLSYGEQSVFKKDNTKDPHMFAVSVLCQSPGVSVKVAEAWLSEFGSLQAVLTASEEELATVKVGGRKQAATAKKFRSLWSAFTP
jgi:hypothetical protein